MCDGRPREDVMPDGNGRCVADYPRLYHGLCYSTIDASRGWQLAVPRWMSLVYPPVGQPAAELGRGARGAGDMGVADACEFDIIVVIRGVASRCARPHP